MTDTATEVETHLLETPESIGEALSLEMYGSVIDKVECNSLDTIVLTFDQGQLQIQITASCTPDGTLFLAIYSASNPS